MFEAYAIGVGAVVGLALVWVAVQIAWRRAFPAAGPDPDALAGRPGCGGGCGCAEPESCESESSNRPGSAEPAVPIESGVARDEPASPWRRKRTHE